MLYLTFGEIQRRATATGLVMSWRGLGIRLRFRDLGISRETWTGLDAKTALEIVKSVEKDLETGFSAGRLQRPVSSFGPSSADP